MVFVIDDAGNNLRELEPFLRFPGPLTIAVLPGLPHSAEAARRIRAAGKEVFLHQPMEALGGQNPGPGAIYAGMDAGEIRRVIEKNLAEVGPVAGMNNHQGSKITMDRNAMETVLAFCRERGIYFLDSRTTAETAAPGAAGRLGMKIGERDVFIDNVQDRAFFRKYIDDGLRQAKRKGAAVMIGHTWSGELAATLTELYGEITAQGYSLTTVSQLMEAK
ncbi:MAG: divergent polysaccharide deacetylase family protein [Treponema sp.]|nr:divergent polysaccharide deacetylase family protein [Treponema sp.]